MGGAIYCQGCNITLKDLSVNKSYAKHGGAFYLEKNTIFNDKNSQYYFNYGDQGAILCVENSINSSYIFNDNTFDSNNCKYGCLIYS
jgi:hypothetical protein